MSYDFSKRLNEGLSTIFPENLFLFNLLEIENSNLLKEASEEDRNCFIELYKVLSEKDIDKLEYRRIRKIILGFKTSLIMLVLPELQTFFEMSTIKRQEMCNEFFKTNSSKGTITDCIEIIKNINSRIGSFSQMTIISLYNNKDNLITDKEQFNNLVKRKEELEENIKNNEVEDVEDIYLAKEMLRKYYEYISNPVIQKLIDKIETMIPNLVLESYKRMIRSVKAQEKAQLSKQCDCFLDPKTLNNKYRTINKRKRGI